MFFKKMTIMTQKPPQNRGNQNLKLFSTRVVSMSNYLYFPHHGLCYIKGFNSMQCLLPELCMTVWSQQQSIDCMGSTYVSAYFVAQTLPRKPDSSSGTHPG